MSASERAVIYVESGTDLSSLAVAASATTASASKSSPSRHNSVSSVRNMSDRDHSSKMSTTTAVVTTAAGSGGGNNYVIKIQIGEENMFNPVRIDVSTGKGGPRVLRQNKNSAIEDESALNSSGQSSPRSDMTPPPRINSGAIRFGSETSESDTESDVSSEFRPLQCQAAQFALREICEAGASSSPPASPRGILKKSGSSPNSGFKSAQFQLTGKRGNVTENSPEFMSLVGVRGAPETRRLKSSSSKTAQISPEFLKAKAELEAEILKRGKLIGTGSPSSSALVPKKVSAARNKDTALTSISEHVAQNGISLHGRAIKVGEDIQQDSEAALLSEPNGFHLNEINECNSKESVVHEGGGPSDSMNNFAGYRDIFTRNTAANPIMSEKGTIRGVKNRVRDGIATFLQSSDSKTYSEREQGRVVVYVTSMGVVRNTFQRCHKVKNILRNLLVKFDERDCYMNRSIQNEIRHRLPNFNHMALPQVFLEGQHLGDAELIEKLNETGELRDLLRPYKSLSVLTTCDRCGGFRMLPCPVCNGSKKSVHRNHFTTEFVALKCMHCDLSGLIRCDLCNTSEA